MRGSPKQGGMSVKVFKMNEYDWVAAETEEQAKSVYEKETGFTKEEIEEEFVGEVSLSNTMLIQLDDLSEEELKKTQVMKNIGGQIWVVKPFAWVIEHENITNPCIIGSTEY